MNFDKPVKHHPVTVIENGVATTYTTLPRDVAERCNAALREGRATVEFRRADGATR